jgi:hypothetical protein
VISVYPHEFPGRDQPCKHCGATFGSEQTCVPHSDAPDASMRPEPIERQYAVNDAKTISARLVELQAERDAATNYVEDATE